MTSCPSMSHNTHTFVLCVFRDACAEESELNDLLTSGTCLEGTFELTFAY